MTAESSGCARPRGPPASVCSVIDNPAGWVSHGLNACIREAQGDLIVRLDCHSRYPGDYLRRCAELSQQTGAWNVGGRLVPDRNDLDRTGRGLCHGQPVRGDRLDALRRGRTG